MRKGTALPTATVSTPITARLRTVTSHIMSTNTGAPLLLYTAPTPNGYKVTAYLEELKIVYGLQYEYVECNVSITHTHAAISGWKRSISA